MSEAGLTHVGWADNVAWLEADEFGRVLAVNQLFSREFGWCAESIVGRPLVTLMPRHFHDAHHNLGMARFVAFGKPRVLGQPLTLPVITAGGESVMAEICLLAGQHRGRWRFGAQLARLDARDGGEK